MIEMTAGKYINECTHFSISRSIPWMDAIYILSKR